MSMDSDTQSSSWSGVREFDSKYGLHSSFQACGGFISYLFYLAGFAYLFKWTPSVSFLLDRCSRKL